MLTVAEVARRLGIGRTLAYALVGAHFRGEEESIPAVRLGGCVRVPAKWVDDVTAGERRLDSRAGPKAIGNVGQRHG